MNFKSLSVMTLVVAMLSSCSNVSVKTGDDFERVELPDGSVAYLNENSSIEYDEDFSPRNIEMTGEVFFDVEKGDVPFIVKTELGKVLVLGTKFNVKSDDKDMDVEVQSGNVEVKAKGKNQNLRRGEKASYNKHRNSFKKGKANFHFRKWMKRMELDLNKLEKDVEHNSKKFIKDSEKLGKDLGKKLNNIKISVEY